MEDRNTRKVLDDRESKYYVPRKSYNKYSHRPYSLEEQVSHLEEKVKTFGFYKMSKRKVDSNDFCKFLTMAEERNIVLVEEDDNTLIFGKTK